jgi:hypothetical protein
MPKFLNTIGMPSVAIAICDRCHRKVPYSELRSDGNTPGLKVCKDKACWDVYDPWRLPARQPERINLRNPRPDTRIGIYYLQLATEVSDSILMAENGQELILKNESDL